MNSARFFATSCAVFLSYGILSCASKGSDSTAQGMGNGPAQKAEGDVNSVQTDDAIRADMKKLDQRVETLATNLKRDTAEGSRKLSAESKAKYNRDMAELKREYSAIESRFSSGANSLGEKISNGTKSALNKVGNAMKTLGDKIGSDPNAQPTSH